jgi:hypothetical protein
MPVESTVSTKELRKTWTGKSRRPTPSSRKPKKAKVCAEEPRCAQPIPLPEIGRSVTLYFKANKCCLPKAKAGLHCSHLAKVVKHTNGKFTAMCYEDKSEWTMCASVKRTDLFPQGNWSDAPNPFYQAKPESEDEDADL